MRRVLFGVVVAGVGGAVVADGCTRARVPRPEVRTWQTDVGGSLVFAAPLARVIASEADQGDGAAGCLAGEVVASVMTAAGYQIAATAAGADPAAVMPHAGRVVDVCRCLALRDDWDAVAVPDELTGYVGSALDGATLMIRPHVRACEGRLWLDSIAAGARELVPAVAGALTLDACMVPIPDLVPDLSPCATATAAP